LYFSKENAILNTVKKGRFFWNISAALFLLLWSCSDVMVPEPPVRSPEEEGAPGPDGIVHVTGVSLDFTTVALTGIGSTQQLTPAIRPSNARKQGLVWASSVSSVASVSPLGLVTALSSGTTLITALTEDGGKAANCLVSVSFSSGSNVGSFNAVAGDAQIELSWVNPTPVPPPVFDGVMISSSPAGGSLASSQFIAASATGYTVTGLANGTSYTIRIKAHYDDGTYSGESSKTVIPATRISDTELYSFINAPLTNVNPSSVSYPTTYNQFTSITRAWKKADDTSHTGVFQAGQVYKAALTITAKPGFTFNGLLSSDFSYTGASITGYAPAPDYKSAVITITFPATAGVELSGTVNSGDGNHDGATAELKMSGTTIATTTVSGGTYTFTNVAAGSYTVVISKAGYSTHTSNTITVAAVNVPVPAATLNLQVYALDLSGIIDAPLPSASPDTTAIPSGAAVNQYTASVSWQKISETGSVPVFEPGSAYKATLTLTRKTGWSFSGLSSDSFSFSGASSVTASIASDGYSATVTVEFPTVQWDDVPAGGGSTVVAQLDWIRNNGEPGTNYTVTVSNDETLAPQTLNVATDTRLINTSITLQGSEAAPLRTLTLASNGSLFTVRGYSSTQKITLVLDGDITLQGRTGNTAPLVSIDTYAALVMKGEVKITGNISSSSGGGVYVSSNSTFTMKGGIISHNKGYSGGGVYADGRFTMEDGTISDNTASYGGGVIAGGKFTMEGGTISDNTASSDGGGVYFYSSSFTMNNGTISGNEAASGGGVYISSGTFKKSGTGSAVIYGDEDGDTDISHTPGADENTASSGSGHAVLLWDGRKRNSDALAGNALDSDKLGTAGGWE
jgi:parallel beta-helix repeat protein